MKNPHEINCLKANGERPARESQSGFTLVELSIVLVIIGLIIGGILKGQELIDNARIKNVVSQIQAYRAATEGFNDKYDGLPGDLLNANLLIPLCTVAPCLPAGADGNGQIGAALNANSSDNVSTGAENVAFWAQLAAARFIGGIDLSATSTLAYGSQIPSAETSGGFQVGFQPLIGRHILRLSGNLTAINAANGALRPDQALQIDSVLDDGQPNTGSVQTNGNISNNTCFTVASNIYAAAGTGRTCNIWIELR